MFNSGISAKDLIDEVVNEVDIAIPITKQSLVNELNALERMLYSEVIKEQAEERIPINIVIIEDGTTEELPDSDFEL